MDFDVLTPNTSVDKRPSGSAFPKGLTPFSGHSPVNQAPPVEARCTIPDEGLTQKEKVTTTRHDARSSQFLPGTEQDWSSLAIKRNKPLRLLDLPLDILKEIIKEVKHTNDLASLALTNSALHKLTIPLIYSRFDIVWPDENNTAGSRTGVDALTYGLATLVMSEGVDGNPSNYRNSSGFGFCEKCTCDDCERARSLSFSQKQPFLNIRRGNRFSQFTRKFSLGNGPNEWVQEYLITKEGGKMLGTLVALAIARMPNLETFVWDMPTGILRDVWTSLSSGSSYLGGQRSRLQKVWIRFHNNKEANGQLELQGPSTTQVSPASSGSTLDASSTSNPVATALLATIDKSYRRVESPNFSILPPLRSLAVLDIDEAAYMCEMDTLLERSIDSLRELRIGMAPYLSGADGWQIPRGTKNSLGAVGVIGLILGRIFMAQPSDNVLSDRSGDPYGPGYSTAMVNPHSSSPSPSVSQLSLLIQSVNQLNIISPTGQQEKESAIENLSSNNLLEPSTLTNPESHNASGGKTEESLIRERFQQCSKTPSISNQYMSSQSVKHKNLRLDVLGIERISLTVLVLQKSIDWSLLSSLTILSCDRHEQLWKVLRRSYAPWPSKSPISSTSPNPKGCSLSYRLNLKKIHTNAVSPGLIMFLKETLAPNSLEWMFLQDGTKYASPVTIEAIFRGPVQRHQASLSKLMIDSAIGPSNVRHDHQRRKWILDREILAFITSGRMRRLRELAMVIKYKDWHFFLQRLPQISHLRSLFIPCMTGHDYNHLKIKELALQVVDVVAIRPEVELCYFGLANTCFEILGYNQADGSYEVHHDLSASITAEVDGENEDHDDYDDDGNNEDIQNVNDTNADLGQQADSEDGTDSDSADSASGDGDDNNLDDGNHTTAFKLREILFYDDKVSIFRARHGRL